MTTEPEAVLRALGAVPASEMEHTLWGDDAGRTAVSKGQRIDVNGWVAPSFVNNDSRLKGEPKYTKESLTFARCASYLNVDKYTTKKDPLQFAIMAITLDRMLAEGIPIENAEPIIKVYESGIGLEDRALRLLKGSVSSDQAIELYQKSEDSRLLDIFPTPQKHEDTYIELLLSAANKHPVRGWLALRLLYEMDKAVYKEDFRNSMFLAAQAARNMDERLPLVDPLFGLGDQSSVEFLAGWLLTDPVTEVREAILSAAVTSKQCSKEFVRSVVMLANGCGREHQPVSQSRMVNQWKYFLSEYLSWVKAHESCDPDSRSKSASTLEVLLSQ